jgi:hypothetical protein
MSTLTPTIKFSNTSILETIMFAGPIKGTYCIAGKFGGELKFGGLVD